MPQAPPPGTITAMRAPLQPHGPPHVVIVGGGAAALEAVLALRAVADEHVAITMVTPASHFAYRPLAVLEAFEQGNVWRLELARFAADQDVALRRARAGRIETDRRRVRTTKGDELPYTRLLIAV